MIRRIFQALPKRQGFIGKKIILVLGILILVILVFLGFINFYLNLRYNFNPLVNGASTKQETARIFTPEELKKYDGSNPNLPIYLALDGQVYDVTAGNSFYKIGGPYHDLAGRDSSADLRLIGGDIIKRKYPVVGKIEIR